MLTHDKIYLRPEVFVLEVRIDSDKRKDFNRFQKFLDAQLFLCHATRNVATL